MIRKSFVMQVNPGQEVEYQRRHSPIWKELADVLSSHGAHNYSIFFDPKTYQLFGYVEIEDEARWNSIASTPVCQRWWKFMGDIMPSNPDNSPVSRELKEVFHLA
jgi:L-rhamnose mutarotase